MRVPLRRLVLRSLLPMLLLAPFLGSCASRPLEPSAPPPMLPPPRPVPVDSPAVRAPEPLPTDPAPGAVRVGAGPLVRVALVAGKNFQPLAATGAWRLLDARGSVVVRARTGEAWSVEQSRLRLRARRADGTATPWSAGPLTQYAEPATSGLLRVGTRRYRGAVRFVATDTGLLVVNVLPLEDYLRGVVPLEIGDRRANERAAVEAQAIAARSYTVTRLVEMQGGVGRSRHFDLLMSVTDQVYGGVDAERPIADAAVQATTGRVLLYRGRVVIAPFHSACGGETAAAQEVWRTGGEPHLQRVSDRIPGSTSAFCDIAPRYSWTRTYTGTELDIVVRRYLASVVAVGRDGPGSVRGMSVESRTPSGRVATLEIRATNGTYSVRGNDARSVLRSVAGEPLNSPYFSLTTEPGPSGRIVRAVITGRGYGHGVGMCQWGAIGRARAGQDVRTILRTYYPGTTIGPIPSGLLTP